MVSARNRGGWHNWLPLVLTGAAWCLPAQPARAEVVLQTIYATVPSLTTIAFSGIVQATDGNFYGTLPMPGAGADGAVFRVTPAGVMTTLARFPGGSSGSDPEGGLVLATNGVLYGTTLSAGTYSAGTLFKITSTGSFQSLHSFSGSDGAYPIFNLIQACDGFLYGVTYRITSNTATVFQAALTGAVTTLTNFAAAMPGFVATPTDGLVQGPDGCLYGTTRIDSPSPNVGSIYKISTNGLFQTLVYFEGQATPPLGAKRRPTRRRVNCRDGWIPVWDNQQRLFCVRNHQRPDLQDDNEWRADDAYDVRRHQWLQSEDPDAVGQGRQPLWRYRSGRSLGPGNDLPGHDRWDPDHAGRRLSGLRNR
jgi:uncharacterized repeat protein (TIGR03803 family)